MTLMLSSLVLRARPEQRTAVRSEIAGLPGVEIYADCEDGRFVLVVEHDPDTSPAAVYDRLHAVDGVLNVSLVYQYSDEALEQEPEA